MRAATGAPERGATRVEVCRARRAVGMGLRNAGRHLGRRRAGPRTGQRGRSEAAAPYSLAARCDRLPH